MCVIIATLTLTGCHSNPDPDPSPDPNPNHDPNPNPNPDPNPKPATHLPMRCPQICRRRTPCTHCAAARARRCRCRRTPCTRCAAGRARNLRREAAAAAFFASQTWVRQHSSAPRLALVSPELRAPIPSPRYRAHACPSALRRCAARPAGGAQPLRRQPRRCASASQCPPPSRAVARHRHDAA